MSAGTSEQRDLRRIMRRLNLRARSLGARERIKPDQIIDHTRGLSDLDPYDLFLSVGDEFGVAVTRAEVREYGGMDLRLPRNEYVRRFRDRRTWAGLAQFVLPKLRAIEVREAWVLGQRCGPAGAFRALRDVARELGAGGDMWPSERVGHYFRGTTLRRYWARVSWLTRYRVPRLRREALFEAGSLVVVAGAFALLVGVLTQSPVATAGAAAAITAGWLLRSRGPRLPLSIVTFRDLATEVWRCARPITGDR